MKRNDITFKQTVEGIEYSNSTRGENLLFFIHGLTVESPLSGKSLKNDKELDYESLIRAEIRKYHKRKKKLVELDKWRLYVECKMYYRDSLMTYEEFMHDNLKEYLNYGYSDELLYPQKLIN